MLKSIDIKFFKALKAVKLEDCRAINVLVGKNHSGKSSVLHAIDMAGLALSRGNWSEFEWKMDIKHLFDSAGAFRIEYHADGFQGVVEQQPRGESPTFPTAIPDDKKFRTVLIVPDPVFGPQRRHHVTPRNVMDQIQSRNFSGFNGLDMLYAVKFYAERNERGLSRRDYEELVAEVRAFFPDLDEIISDRTDQDISTLTYREYGVSRDIVYSGGGIKHLVDILIKIRLSQANVVLLDEPENSLHPDLQRALLELLQRYARERGVQFFVTTHSPVFLQPADDIAVFSVRNTNGARSVSRIQENALHTAWGDLGLRPGDFLQKDAVLLVEGQTDVIFFETVIEKLWKDDLKGITVGVQQYGGDAAAAISSGRIDVSNITPLNHHVMWTRDRDARPGVDPSKTTRDFANALTKAGQSVHVLGRREIEYYFPEAVLREAQGADVEKQTRAVSALGGPQDEKLRNLAVEQGFQLPGGKLLRELLQRHLTAAHLADIESEIKPTLVEWRKQIRG